MGRSVVGSGGVGNVLERRRNATGKAREHALVEAHAAVGEALGFGPIDDPEGLGLGVEQPRRDGLAEELLDLLDDVHRQRIDEAITRVVGGE